MPNFTFDQLKAGYTPLWDGIQVTNKVAANREAKKIIDNKVVYKAIEKQTGVPWFCIGIIHTREAGSVDVGRWLCCLHNGEKIIGTGRKTRLVPADRGPFATFEEAAADALKGYKGTKWSVEFLAYTLEKFNGFGYRSKGIPSPYLWGATNKQKRGKYVSDGVYDPNTMDSQVGGMAILKSMMDMDKTINFNAPASTGSTAGVATASIFVVLATFFKEHWLEIAVGGTMVGGLVWLTIHRIKQLKLEGKL